MKTSTAMMIAFVTACATPDPLSSLEATAVAVVRSQQPALDALVTRIMRLKRELRGNLPGWEMMLRSAEAANDRLGLQPFTQTEAPGPAWRPSSASLLGIGPYVLVRARELARQERRRELAFLVEDERRRYREGIADVEGRVAVVERWLAARASQAQ